MSETPEGRPRPTPRPRPGAAPRPSPRPRVAGSRRDRDENEPPARPARPVAAPRPEQNGTAKVPAAGRGATARPERSRATPTAAAAPRRGTALVLALALLCVLAAAGVGVLLWQRVHPSSVNASIFDAARSEVQALYAYDYKDSKGSVKNKLAVVTGDLHDQYERDLSKGGIIDTYEQVSATTRYEVLDVGLRSVNESQDTAKVVVFGQYVVKSVNTGTQPAPEGSECQVTPEGASSCTQTVELSMVKVDGDWKIDDAVIKTTS